MTSDINCFLKPPVFKSEKRWLVNTWDIEIEFELRWDVAQNIGYGNHTPSLKVIDENAPLGVGFTSINIYTWAIHSGIELRINNIEDKKAPFGTKINDVMYVHDGDTVDITIQAYHLGYEYPATNLPFRTQYTLELIGDLNYSLKEGDLDSKGKAILRIVFNSSYYGTQIKFIATIDDVYDHEKVGDSSDLVIDLNPPDFTVSDGYLVTVDSDSLENVGVELRLTDDQGLGDAAIIMKWRYVRNGRIIEQAPQIEEIPVSFGSIRNNIYSDTINMQPEFELQKGDYLIIWFEGKDASGHAMNGIGTDSSSPMETIIQWIAYEPLLFDIISNPYRPSLGEIITINYTVANTGLLNGESTIRLLDENGIILNEINKSMPVDYSFNSGFEIEAYKLGDLGLKIQIDNNTPIPIPLANVEGDIDDASSSQSILLGIAFSTFFIAAIFLLYVSSRNNSKRFFDEEE